jgi:PAS domain S-box-containing protein
MVRKSNRASTGPLLNSLLELSDFVDTTDVGLIYHDVDGTIVDCNPGAAVLFGHSQEELIGLDIAEQNKGVVTRNGSPFKELQRPVLRTVREGRAVYGETIGLDLPGRQRRWLNINTEPLFEDGEVVGVISTYVDVTNEISRRRMLELGASVNALIRGASDESSVLQGLCDLLVSDGDYALAGIASPVPDDSGDCEYLFTAGQTDYLFTGIASILENNPRSRGPTGVAFRTGVTQVVNNFPAAASFDPWRDRASQYGVCSAVVIPIAVSRPSVLAIYDRHPVAFDDVLVEGLEGLVREVERGCALLTSVDQARQSLEGTIRALSVITESRDPYTEGHEVRVGALGAAIAAHMGLDAGLVRLIRLAGEVHDVGKVSIPAEVLTSPRNLVGMELELVKEHSTVGEEILASALLPWPIPEVARQHHERVNGSGYPLGLRGEDIILPARIIAVADVVEAMVNDRPFRLALGMDSARDELLAGKGILYDADVVDACLAVFENGFTFDGLAVASPLRFI